MKVIGLSGIVGWDITAEKLRKDLEALNGEAVRLEINSPGGSVFDGIEMFNIIRNYEGETETRVISLGASMGSIIALAGKKRTAEDTAVYMIHNAAGFALGDYRDMEKTAELLKAISNHMANIYANISGIAKDEIQAMMDAESWFFGEELAKFGFEIIKTENEKDKDTAEAIAKLDYEACVEKLKKSAEKPQSEQIAALLGKIENKSSVEPLDGEKILEEDMDKDKLKAEFPDLYKEIVNEGNTEAVKSAMENVAEILSLAGIAKETIQNATSGMNSGDFAKAELKRQQEVRAQADDAAGVQTIAVKDPTPKATAPEPTKIKGLKDEVTPEQAAEIAAWDALYEKTEAN